ncbi:uncharacterized protein LOC141811563 [Curcuma longa]|uniref:uncharacterized protein LOC141811563 n=1 Tax=Curcuma longa TaxID=136217 RepID=UPI003D9DB659
MATLPAAPLRWPSASCTAASHLPHLPLPSAIAAVLVRILSLPDKDFIQEQLNKRASYLSSRLIGTSTGQLVVVPCNIGFHWILTMINVEKEIVYLLDPLRHRIYDQDWKYVVNMALTLYNAEAGRKGKKQPTWEVVKAPRQPDAKQCGFYIMRYMKDIIENFGVGDKESLPSLFTNLKYTLVEINEVRSEWAECMLDYI